MADKPVTNTGTTDLQAAISGWGSVSAGDAVYLGQGSQEFTTNTDLSATDLSLFHATRGWSGNFDASPLQVLLNRTGTGKLVIESAGRVFRFQSTNTPGVIEYVESAPQRSDCRVHCSQANVELFSAVRGINYIEATGDVNKVEAYQDAEVTLRATGSYTPAVISSWGSRVNCERDVATVNAFASKDGRQGLVVLGNENAAAAVSPATIYIDGGYVKLRNISSVSTKVWGRAGVLDLTELTAPVQFADAELHPSLTMLVGAIEPTYGTGPSKRYGGATIIRR